MCRITDALKLTVRLGEVVIATLVGFATWLGLFDNEKGYTVQMRQRITYAMLHVLDT